MIRKGAAVAPFSGQNADRGAGADHGIDLFDLTICHSNATGGPIRGFFLGSLPESPLGLRCFGSRAAVDKDIASRLLALSRSIGAIGRIWIADLQRQMKAGFWILGADVIDAFWCLHIAFKLFMPNGVASQIDVIGFHHLTVVQHIHLAFGFMHLDHIYGGAVIGLELGVAGGQHQPSKHNQEDTKNMHDLPAFFVFGAF